MNTLANGCPDGYGCQSELSGALQGYCCSINGTATFIENDHFLNENCVKRILRKHDLQIFAQIRKNILLTKTVQCLGHVLLDSSWPARLDIPARLSTTTCSVTVVRYQWWFLSFKLLSWFCIVELVTKLFKQLSHQTAYFPKKKKQNKTLVLGCRDGFCIRWMPTGRNCLHGS